MPGGCYTILVYMASPLTPSFANVRREPKVSFKSVEFLRLPRVEKPFVCLRALQCISAQLKAAPMLGQRKFMLLKTCLWELALTHISSTQVLLPPLSVCFRAGLIFCLQGFFFWPSPGQQRPLYPRRVEKKSRHSWDPDQVERGPQQAKLRTGGSGTQNRRIKNQAQICFLLTKLETYSESHHHSPESAKRPQAVIHEAH